MMNEGCATFIHYYIMNRLHQRGLLTEGAMIEFLQSHTAAVFQPDYDHPGYYGINPYAFGFGLMQDIRRICEHPTDEDRAWNPEISGCGDWIGALKDAWTNHRDESFIRQYLSPHLIRKMKFFDLYDDGKSDLLVKAIHNEHGYRTIRTNLADQFDTVQNEPEIEIVDVDLNGDRKLILHHRIYNGRLIDERDVKDVLRHLANLWGYEVILSEVSAQTEATVKQYSVGPQR
jgi:stage V sporulation protein R